MNMKRLLWGINEEVKAMIDSQFTINVNSSSTIPQIDSGNLTFPDFTNNKLEAIEIETTVLFIDIRKSTDISSNHRRKTLAKLYSAFIRSMVQASEYFGGKVRNIIGDRVMVVFDTKDCIINAVNTGILLNSVSKYIINKHFTYNKIECGIGIDYGKMLVVKTGTIKRSTANREYKALVWLGNTANVASKLTDVANKKFNLTKYKIEYLNNNNMGFPFIGSFDAFGLKALDNTYSSMVPEKKEVILSEKDFLEGIRNSTNGIRYRCFGNIKSFEKINIESTSLPLLITEEVYILLSKNYPDEKCVKEKAWEIQDIDDIDYKGKVYGINYIYTDVKNI